MFPDRSYESLKVGEKATHTKTLSESDIYLFAGITGDTHPIHTNAEYAKTTPYGERLVHGILSTGLASAATAMLLGASPGGYLLVGVNIRYTAPVKIGDTITAIAEVAEKRDDKKLVRVRAQCVNQKGEVVLEGDIYEKKG